MKIHIFILLILFTLLAHCSTQNENDYSIENNVKTVVIGNPYSSGTGHYAGYEWAERTGGACDGKSASFNEGCEEYYRQISEQ